MTPQTQLRIARPVSSLQRSVAMYCQGMGLEEIDSFADHDGFDGVMLGRKGLHYHLEFTCSRNHPVSPSPTVEDLLVFYIPDIQEWQDTCDSMLAAGFVEAETNNPYWRIRGRTFEDPDGYRVVLQQEAWQAT